MCGVRHQDRVGIGDRCHIDHIHVTLGLFPPDTLGPFELDYAGQPPLALIRVKYVPHKGDLAGHVERIDEHIFR